MQALILAGGLATRMRPATNVVPKSMLRVAGRPFIDWQLESLACQGVIDVVLCVGHLSEPIRQFVGSGERWGLSVRYSDEGTELRGTAGAARLALERGLLADEFLVTYGDSYLRLDFIPAREILAREHGVDAVMMVFANHGLLDRSNVAVSGGKVALYARVDDPVPAGTTLDHIDYGASLMKRAVLMALPSDYLGGLPDVFARLSSEGRLAALPVQQRFFEVGSREGLSDLEAWLEIHPRGWCGVATGIESGR